MRRLFAALLILALLTLSACAIPIGAEVYTTPPTDPPPTERYTSDEVAELGSGVYYYLMTETIEDQVAGVTTRTEYIPGEDHPRIGMVQYENGEEVRREDWELDVRENITKCTVTVDNCIQEVYEYGLTYNEDLNLVTRICNLNGQWQYTEEFQYAPKYPDRLVCRYVSFPGEDNPPWYLYDYYDDSNLWHISRVQAKEAKYYKISGSVDHKETRIYGEDGRLQENRIWEPLETSGYLNETQIYSYDDDALTVTIHTYDGDDNLLRITTREYAAVTIS